jgi:hypothetical protein
MMTELQFNAVIWGFLFLGVTGMLWWSDIKKRKKNGN